MASIFAKITRCNANWFSGRLARGEGWTAGTGVMEDGAEALATVGEERAAAGSRKPQMEDIEWSPVSRYCPLDVETFALT